MGTYSSSGMALGFSPRAIPRNDFSYPIHLDCLSKHDPDTAIPIFEINLHYPLYSHISPLRTDFPSPAGDRVNTL